MLRGVHTALVTPFDSEGVALETFRSLCHRQVEAGIHGLVPCGTTGETPTLTADEWAQVIQTAVEVADGSVPVTAGCGTKVQRRHMEKHTSEDGPCPKAAEVRKEREKARLADKIKAMLDEAEKSPRCELFFWHKLAHVDRSGVVHLGPCA